MCIYIYIIIYVSISGLLSIKLGHIWTYQLMQPTWRDAERTWASVCPGTLGVKSGDAMWIENLR